MRDLENDLYLHQQRIHTTTPAGKAMFQMFGVFAEFERSIIRERINAGLARTRATGKRLGRPKVDPEVEEAIRQALNRKGMRIRKIAREMGVAVSVVRRAVAAQKNGPESSLGALNKGDDGHDVDSTSTIAESEVRGLVLAEGTTPTRKWRRKRKTTMSKKGKQLQKELSEDITELKRGEQALTESQGLLQTVIDSVPHAIYVKNTSDHYVLVNRKFADLLGLKPEQLVDLTTKKLPGLTEQARAAILEEDRRVIETGEEVINPHLVVRAPNRPAMIRHVHKTPLLDRENRVVGIIAISEDITERKQAEEALLLSQGRFEAVFNNSPASIILKDLEGRYVLVNRTFEKQRGLVPGEIIGKTSHDLHPKEIAERMDADEREVIERRVVIAKEEEFVFGDGTKRVMSYNKFPVLEGEQRLVGVGTIATDITDQREVENQLRESQKMEVVGQLAGGIAHEFNNMMQIIISSADFAQKHLHNQEIVKEFLGTIQKSGKRAADLTQQLLNFSRRNPIQPETVNLNDLTSNLIDLLRPVIGENIELERKYSEDLDQVEVDPGLLEQVLLNLCFNARDSMPDGGRLILETQNHYADPGFCDSHGLEHPGRFVMLSVSDTGIGMPIETREHIFEPFFTTKDVGQGTGLGLAMVYGVVQQHHGAIEVVSQPGAGSTFKIYLPSSKPKEEKKSEPTVRELRGGGETILVAEDQEDVLRMLSIILKGQGYRVLTAKDGEQAWSIFQEEADQVDLVILDVVMPKLKGREVFDKICEEGSNVPVIFSTGYSPESIDAEFIARNGLNLIQKPFSSEKLLHLVREILD